MCYPNPRSAKGKHLKEITRNNVNNNDLAKSAESAQKSK